MPLKPQDKYILEKSVWTHADFDKMGWHDVFIHACSFQPEERELLLDIDYIFAWVDPEPPAPYFTFWIAPSTLVFDDVHDFKAELGEPLGLQIMDLNRIDAHTPFASTWTWKLELLQGKMEFLSTSFSQYTRKAPIHHRFQSLTLAERGGVSFLRSTSAEI